ncbi:MAG: hypothetical protein JXB50_11200 [Spirochaetes bacterium]|nr:hypothetical protein [Spirochaetota bacterium]
MTGGFYCIARHAVALLVNFFCHCEERSDEAIYKQAFKSFSYEKLIFIM